MVVEGDTEAWEKCVADARESWHLQLDSGHGSSTMPSVAAKTPSYDELRSLFPLTFPIPSPVTRPELLTPKDIHREEDLLRNPTSFRAWWTVLQATRESYVAQEKLERGLDIPTEIRAILGPLATPSARLSLQRLTYLYEAALVNFAGSFKLWKSYLLMRMSFICGKPVVKKRAGGKKKFPEMKEALEDEVDDLEEWEGPLDPIIGFEEWRSLVATFERALMYLPKVCPEH
jgi:pre-mRNA-splicing factor SYF1